MMTSPSMRSKYSFARQIANDCGRGFVVFSPSSSYLTNIIAGCVVNAFVAVAGIILNSFVLFIFWKSQKMRKKISCFMIMVLLSTDLGVVSIVIPTFLLQSVSGILETAKCLYSFCYEFAALTLSGMSGVTLIVMNTERYLSIVHPVYHRAAVTKRKCILILVLFWLVVLGSSVCRFILPLYAYLAFTVICSIIICTSLFTYLSIFYTARKQLSKVHRVANATNREVTRKFTSFLRELRMAKTYLLIVTLCLACYLPGPIFTSIWRPWMTKEGTRGILVQVYPWFPTLVAINSTFNCLIFFWGNREVRKEALKVVKKCVFVRQDL